MTRKNRRQQAWLRLMLRHKLPALMARLQVMYLRVRIRAANWNAARLQRAQIRKMKRIVAQQRIDPNAPCPSCGARDGKIAFSPAHGRVLHRCNPCTAVWAESPIVAWENWKVEAGGGDDLPDPIAMLQDFQRSRAQDLSLVKPEAKSKVM